MSKYLDEAGLAFYDGKMKERLAKKQDRLTGTAGQVVGFDSNGNPAAQSTDSLAGAKGDKGDPGLFYGICDSLSSATEKVVSIDGFSLVEGVVVAVKFTYPNGASRSTLNVNKTGAKLIAKCGSTDSTEYMWRAGELVEFVYDGTYWVMARGGLADTTYYGVTKLSTSTSSNSVILAATPSAVKKAYDLANAALPKSGGTMTGALSVQTPTADAHAVNKKYVDTLFSQVTTTSNANAVIVRIELYNQGAQFKSYNVKCYPADVETLSYSINFYVGNMLDTKPTWIKILPPYQYAFTGLYQSSGVILEVYDDTTNRHSSPGIVSDDNENYIYMDAPANAGNGYWIISGSFTLEVA